MERAMTSMMRRAAAVSAFALLGTVALPAAGVRAGQFDGSRPFLCAMTTIMECDGSGQCERRTHEAASAPTFLRFDVGTHVLTAGANRRTTFRSQRLDGRLILQGGENGRGWSATINEESGQLAAAVVDDDFTFSIFGACTLP
jgi:hypothetical protein